MEKEESFICSKRKKRVHFITTEALEVEYVSEKPFEKQKTEGNRSCMARGLATVQVIKGAVLLLLGGIVALRTPCKAELCLPQNREPYLRLSLWSTTWILFTGLVGVLATHVFDETSDVLNIFYRLLLMTSAVIAFVTSACFIFFINQCMVVLFNGKEENTTLPCNFNLGLIIPMLLMMLIEFLISIFAAVLTCQNENQMNTVAEIVLNTMIASSGNGIIEQKM